MSGWAFSIFVQEQHAMRLFVDGFGQKAALFKADVARRCADEARYSMAFHVFGHIKALQRYAH